MYQFEIYLNQLRKLFITYLKFLVKLGKIVEGEESLQLPRSGKIQLHKFLFTNCETNKQLQFVVIVLRRQQTVM